MSEARSSLNKELEALVQKTIEANKLFIKESGNLFQQATRNRGEKITVPFLQGDFISKALNAYASLNIQYVKNMIDLGISLTQSRSDKATEDTEDRTETAGEMAPAFVLTAEGKRGDTIRLQFVLDNSKQEVVTSELVSSSFILLEDPSYNGSFGVTFAPQSFLLEPAASQTVDISIKAAKKNLPGLYTSHVQVKGFEPAYFSIHLTLH